MTSSRAEASRLPRDLKGYTLLTEATQFGTQYVRVAFK